MPIKYSDLHEEYQGLADDLGSPCDRTPFSAEDLAYMADRLPPRLVEFMQYSGNATYLEGAVTVCNPREMAPILALVFKADRDLNHRDCTVVSYSAFGTLDLWSNRYGSPRIMLAEGEISSQALAPVQFAAGLIPKPKGEPDPNIVSAGSVIDRIENADFLDYAGQPMFQRCVSAHGQLGLGECYGFFPALGLVGWDSPTRSVAHIRKAPALEHFAILAQLQPFYLTTVGKTGVERVREIG